MRDRVSILGRSLPGTGLGVASIIAGGLMPALLDGDLAAAATSGAAA
nr:hypothetical protein [Pseudomonas sp.]